jgi:hypothetical protein
MPTPTAVGMPTVGRIEIAKQSRFHTSDNCTLMREAIWARARTACSPHNKYTTGVAITSRWTKWSEFGFNI